MELEAEPCLLKWLVFILALVQTGETEGLLHSLFYSSFIENVETSGWVWLSAN